MDDYNPRTRYEHYYVRMARLEGRGELQKRYPDDFYVRPFQIAGNVYYIGNKAVCSHLIDTGEGLIVIDTSYPELDHLLINSIWEAGFDPKDIRIVLHTHLHYDHFGATNTLTKIYGAKAYVGRDEWESVQRKPELAVIPQDPYLSYRMIRPDVLLEDGDEIRLGNTVIHCIETAGHTEGTMSFFFDVEDNGHIWHAERLAAQDSLRCTKSSLHVWPVGSSARISPLAGKNEGTECATGAGKSSCTEPHPAKDGKKACRSGCRKSVH